MDLIKDGAARILASKATQEIGAKLVDRSKIKPVQCEREACPVGTFELQAMGGCALQGGLCVISAEWKNVLETRLVEKGKRCNLVFIDCSCQVE